MGLKDLLKDPSLYKVGEEGVRIPTINFTSKGLDYKDGEGPLLGRRISFDITNENADPTFEIGNDYKRNSIDQFVRGGIKYANEAREIDFNRIKKFLETSDGRLFITKQITLQAQNPRPQKIYNGGVNTLASVASAGVSNIRRGGLLPSLGNINAFDADTYIGEVGQEEKSNLRENKYGLGDPGYIDSKSIIESLKSTFNLGSKEGYNARVYKKIDKINLLPVINMNDQENDTLNKTAKDFVPFRFRIINQDGGNDDFIIFRAFLDNISDDYNASHNTIKYLAAQTAPNYSSQGRMRTPYLKLTVGDWFNNLPGLITSIGLSWQRDYPWEIALDRTSETGNIEGKDKDMLILPHVLDVSLSFQPIHDFTPNNGTKSPFIGINGTINTINWLDDSKDITEVIGKDSNDNSVIKVNTSTYNT